MLLNNEPMRFAEKGTTFPQECGPLFAAFSFRALRQTVFCDSAAQGFFVMD